MLRFSVGKIKEARGGVSRHRLTRDIEEQTGVQIREQSWYNYETGRGAPSLRTMLAIMEYFNLPLSAFLEEIPERSPVERLYDDGTIPEQHEAETDDQEAEG